MLLSIYDTETSGLPLWDVPSDDERQPHIVQLSCLLVDTDTRTTISGFNMIASPDGWTIPAEVEKVHGISTEYATRVGLPEAFLVNCLWCLWEQSDARLAHNENFDARIVRIALKRFYGGQGPIDSTDEREPPDIWKAGVAYCTARLATPIMKMAATAKMVAAGRKHAKTPKLTEAYEFFFGVPLEDAHNALVDTEACRDVYFAIQDHIAAHGGAEPKEPKSPGYSGGKAGAVGKDAERPPSAGDDDVSFLGS